MKEEILMSKKKSNNKEFEDVKITNKIDKKISDI